MADSPTASSDRPAGGSETTRPAGGSGGTSSFTMPKEFEGKSAEDIAREFVGLKSQYDELKPQYESYAKVGKPEALAQTVEWAKALYQGMSGGKAVILDTKTGQLRYVDPAELTPKQQQQSVQQQEQQIDYDELTPSQLRAKIREEMRAEMEGMVAAREKTLKEGLDGSVKSIQTQNDLTRRVLQAIVKNPGMDVEQILSKAAELAQAPPDKLLEIAMGQLTVPDQIKRAQEQTRAEVLAELKQKQENDQMAALRPQGGRLLKLMNQQKQSPQERAIERRREIARKMSELRASNE